MPDETSRLTLETHRSGDQILVRCRGKLVAGVNDILYSEVSQLIPGAKRVVLDLTELTHMDSMGLGTLIRLYVSCRSAGCDLELVNLAPRIRQLLGVTRLMPILAGLGKSGVPYI